MDVQANISTERARLDKIRPVTDKRGFGQHQSPAGKVNDRTDGSKHQGREQSAPKEKLPALEAAETRNDVQESGEHHILDVRV